MASLEWLLATDGNLSSYTEQNITGTAHKITTQETYQVITPTRVKHLLKTSFPRGRNLFTVDVHKSPPLYKWQAIAGAKVQELPLLPAITARQAN